MTFYLHLKYSASFVALRSSWWLLHLLRQIQSDFTGQIQLSSMMWFLCEQVQTWPFSCLHVSSVAVNDVSFIDFLCHWRSTERLYSRSFSTEHNQSPNCWLCHTVELLIDRGIWSLVMDQILFPCTIVLDILEYVSLAPAKHLSLQRQRQCIIYAQWFIHASLVSFTEFHFNIKINLSMFLKKKKRAKKLVGFFFVLFWFGFFFNFYLQDSWSEMLPGQIKAFGGRALLCRERFIWDRCRICFTAAFKQLYKICWAAYTALHRFLQISMPVLARNYLQLKIITD